MRKIFLVVALVVAIVFEAQYVDAAELDVMTQIESETEDAGRKIEEFYNSKYSIVDLPRCEMTSNDVAEAVIGEYASVEPVYPFPYKKIAKKSVANTTWCTIYLVNDNGAVSVFLIGETLSSLVCTFFYKILSR